LLGANATTANGYLRQKAYLLQVLKQKMAELQTK
jgi:hypothetical protein